MPRSVFSDGYKSMLDVLVAARKEAGVTHGRIGEATRQAAAIYFLL